MTFTPDAEGTYHASCQKFCGAEHAENEADDRGGVGPMTGFRRRPLIGLLLPLLVIVQACKVSHSGRNSVLPAITKDQAFGIRLGARKDKPIPADRRRI